MCSWENNEEIERFREYLRIPSVHPNVDYAPCVEFLKKQAKDLGLPIEVYYPGSRDKPSVVITWIGEHPELPTIILNSHMDVVPVYPEKWTHPPFSAHMDETGRIYARGSQDMKCCGMQYLAAVRALRKNGVTLKRTVHIVFVPDEEISGEMGMKGFVKSPEFKKLNVGFALDEGIASENETFPVFYGERTLWHVHFLISGTAGHGSLLLKNTVGEKFHYLLGKFMAFRQNEVDRLEKDPKLKLGDATTINLTLVKCGIQNNVVPAVMEAVFDMRLALNVDPDELDKQMRAWCEEAGGGIEIVYEQRNPKVETTKIDDSNIYWVAFEKAIKELYSVSNGWNSIKSMITPRLYGSAVSLFGKIYVIGGYDGKADLKSVECYDPTTNCWTQCTEMNEFRSNHSASVRNGQIYVLGGYNGFIHTSTPIVERYDPQRNEWTKICSLSVGLELMGSISFENQLWCVGGYSGFDLENFVSVYDDQNNKWIDKKPAPLYGSYYCFAVSKSLLLSE